MGALAVTALIVAGCSANGGAAGTAGPTSGEQSAHAGNVKVTAEPTVYDATSARITHRLDTRSGDLDLPLPQAATLTIAGQRWPAQSWRGDPPGGRHREGTLTFAAAGPLTGTAALTLTGLPGPVQLSLIAQHDGSFRYGLRGSKVAALAGSRTRPPHARPVGTRRPSRKLHGCTRISLIVSPDR